MTQEDRRRGRFEQPTPLDPLERVRRLVGVDASPDPSLVIMRKDLVYHTGTVAPILGTGFRQAASGLTVPSRQLGKTLVDYTYTYLTSDQYFDEDPRFVARWVIDRYPTEDLLVSLAALGRMAQEDAVASGLTESYLAQLNPVSRARAESVLSDRRHVFMARQPVLNALMLTLSRPAREGPTGLPLPAMPVDTAAVLLTHAVAGLLGAGLGSVDSEPKLGGWPTSLAMSLVQNWYFNSADDPAAQMIRFDRLWKIYADRTKKYRPRPPAMQQLERAIGMSFEDFMTLGFALYSQAVVWQPNTPLLMTRDMGLPADQDLVTRFVSLVSLPLVDYQHEVLNVKTEWDFLALERWPVVDLGQTGLLVIDTTFMLDRMTKELWRYVDDEAKEPFRTQWRQFYGEATELLAEDQVARLAPTDLANGKAWYFTEEDFQALYSGKACDAATCYGDDWCLFEVVTTRVSGSAKFGGDADAFVEDTKKIVIKKARQLDSTGRQLFRGVSTTVSDMPIAAARVFPIVVTSDQYPSVPATATLIRELLAAEELLSDPRFQPLAVLDLADLELLEALLDIGETPNIVLANWRQSDLADVSLRNYIHAHYSGRISRRPGRMQPQFEAVLEPVFRKLREWGIGPDEGD